MGLLYLKGSTPKEALDMRCKMDYGLHAPSYDSVKHWHGQFKCGRTSVETVPIPGHPAIQQVETAILEDRRVTERQLVHDVKISLGLWKNNL